MVDLIGAGLIVSGLFLSIQARARAPQCKDIRHELESSGKNMTQVMAVA